MKNFKNQAAQGDVLFRRIKALPSTAKPLERKNGEPLVATHSETGHHHVIRNAGVAMFDEPGNPLLSYLRLEAGVSMEVEHLRPHDTHETLGLARVSKRASVFEVRRQREHTPEGWRQIQD